MYLFDLIIFLTLLFSVLMVGLTILMLVRYNRAFPLPESKYTLLFGFVSRMHVLIAYVGFTILYVLLTLFFLFSL